MIKRSLLYSLVILILLSACNSGPNPTTAPVKKTETSSAPLAVTPSPSPTPLPPRQLTICMPTEPESLFLYGDASEAARGIREAIYDGPIDLRNFALSPVILDALPTLENGGAALQPVEVSPHDLIIDSQGTLTNLAEGVSYFPSGCAALDCAQTYSGQDPVSMDQLVARFKLLPGVQWSDGVPVTAADSLYSFEIAHALGASARPELLARTQSYQVVDESSLEWRGIPGLRDPYYAENFFGPLPRHAWSDLTAGQIMTDTLSTRSPLGWGPYVISNWSPQSSLTLTLNPNYFRAGEGRPAFDVLQFRFVPDAGQALAALQAGECDVLDPAYGFSPQDAQVQSLQQAGQAAVVEIPGAAWEHLEFGINSAVVDPQRPPFFQSKEVRQATAQCIDRQKLVDELAPGQSVLDSFTPPNHPMYNPDVQKYPFDPAAANAMLQAAGWVDTDNDPATPRLALGAPGVPDGTPFVVNLLTGDEPDRQRLAQLIKESLAQCGVQVEITAGPAEQIFAPGPEGPVFGRQFSLAQFAWPTSPSPACFLYTTREIPGPFPQFPKGWGGANASGFSSAEFDQACQQAGNMLPDQPERLNAYQQAQAIFAEQLPVLPLFLRSRWVITRPDFCGFEVDPSNTNIYWNLENFNDGEACK